MDNTATVVAKESGDELSLTFAGSLNLDTLNETWKDSFKLLHKHKNPALTLDLHQVTHCDEAGVNLLVNLEREQKKSGKKFKINGLSKEAQALYNFVSKLPELKAKTETADSMIAQTGRYVMNVAQETKENIAFLGEVFCQFFTALAHPKLIRWRDVWVITQKTGPGGFGIIALMGLLLGLILAFQGAVALQMFGAQIYIANLVGISLFRELAPLMTAIIVLGRSASAFAAEIGTMTVNQEIDALKTMGFKPMHFLVMPRLFAGVTMVPLLTVFMNFFGLIGCGVVMRCFGFSTHIYLSQLGSALAVSDFVTGLVKSVFFGLIIAGIGCAYGLRTQMKATGVGQSTTKAVVNGIVFLVIADGIFAILYYALGL
jgi:phospholipid/cholesterol/gamma-HCH transport system permease protein